MTAGDPSSVNRLYWQCRRGMRELDDLLMGFLEKSFSTLDEDEKQTFEELLTCNDTLLLEYLMGSTVPRNPDTANIVNKIRTAARTSF